MLTTAEACLRLKCCTATLNNHLRKGKFPNAIRRGRVWLIPESDLDGFRLLTNEEARQIASRARRVSDEVITKMAESVHAGDRESLLKASGRNSHATYALLRARGIVARESKARRRLEKLVAFGADERMRDAFDAIWKEYGLHLERWSRSLDPSNPEGLLSDALLFMWEKIGENKQVPEAFGPWAKAILVKLASNGRDTRVTYADELILTAADPRGYSDLLHPSLREVYRHEVTRTPLRWDTVI